jgi:predicted dehydrogenase
MTMGLAIVGAGGIGAQHAAAARTLPEAWRITHICDLNPALARPLAETCQARATDDLADVLADPAVEVVDICLPPMLHVPVALRALAAGKHVICEKPIAGSLADIDRLRAGVAASGCRLFPVFQYRYGRAFRRLARLQDLGLLGAPRIATLETHWNREAGYYDIPWRGKWAHEMGGAILSHSIHIHDLICRFFGPIAGVAAMTDTLVNPIETEDCAAIALRMANGALVTSSVTLGAAGDESRLRLVFERATAESARLPYTPGQGEWTIRARNAAHQPELDAITGDDAPEGFVGYFHDVAEALMGRTNTAVTLEDGAASIALVTAIYTSQRMGGRVTLPILPDAPLYQGWVPERAGADR